MDAAQRLIVALDVPNRERADALCEQLAGVVSWVKVGLQLYLSEGPDLVRDYVAAGREVFVDLKLHDIPATVAHATESLAKLGAGLLTVHASGGLAMMKAAVNAANEGSGGGLGILAVTALTSLDQGDLAQIGVQMPIADVVLKRGLLAAEAGCAGVVASPHEAAALRAVLPKEMLIVTPGIRPQGAALGDQKRVMTPRAARQAGADMIVVGRPIRDADSPASAALEILSQLAE